MDVQLPLSVSKIPFLSVFTVGMAASVLLVCLDYPGCALWLLLATVWDAFVAWRAWRTAPVALTGQGMRWWKVDPQGEMVGPFWLDVRTRHGAAWMTLCLRDADRRRHRLLLGRWCMTADAWRQLKWRVLEQAQHLEKVRPL